MKTKQCSKCKEFKPLTEFHKHKNAPDGLRYSCKQCGNVRLAEYRKKNAKKYKEMIKKWRKKNKSKLKEQSQTPHRKEYMKKWRQKPENKKKAAKRLREYRENNPEKRALIQRKSMLKNTYGVTLDWYDSKLEEQKGRCAICGVDNPQRENTKHFSIDHNHSTGKVRGLLCVRCNTFIGYANEHPNVLQSAIKYLKKYNG